MSESKELSVIDLFYQKGLDLATLQVTYAELPDITDKKNYELVEEGIKELKKYYSAVDATHKTHKRKIIDDGRALDKEKNRLRTGLKDIFDPMVKLKSDFDNRKKREKEELEEKLNKQIADMREKSEIAIGKTSKEISDLINKVGEVDVSHGFYHLTAEAAKARNETLEKLTTMLNNELQAEKEREELAEFKRKEAERKKNEIEEKHELALDLNIVFDFKREEQAKKDAEIQAEADRITEVERAAKQAEKDAEEAKEKAKQAEIDLIAAEKKAEDDKEEARRQAIIDKDKAALDAKEKAENDAKIEADRVENKRLEDERKKKADDKRRAENKEHAGKIHTGIVNKMIELGASKDTATNIVIAMARKEFDNVRINY